MASIKRKRIKVRIKLNHSIPILNPQPICINITSFSGVYLIDSIHLQTNMAPVHFTFIPRVRLMWKGIFSQNNNIMYARFYE